MQSQRAGESPLSKRSQLEKRLLHEAGRAIAEFNLIEQGDRILVGVSGGKDRDAPAGGDGDDDEQDARQLGLFGVAAS